LAYVLSPATRALIYFDTVPRVHTRGFMLVTRYAGSRSIDFPVERSTAPLKYNSGVMIEKFGFALSGVNYHLPHRSAGKPLDKNANNSG
jgi:hypothetical protein